MRNRVFTREERALIAERFARVGYEPPEWALAMARAEQKELIK